MSYSKKQVYALLDITSLSISDTPSHIHSIIREVNQHVNQGYIPAAICVYPNFGELVKKEAHPKIKTAVVSACFPASQSFREVKLLECQKAIDTGADEVDIVMNVGAFLAGDFSAVSKEIKDIKSVVGNKTLKVILETGILNSQQITKASEIAIAAGADFLKTSTGKVNVGATVDAVRLMCNAIVKSGKKTGIKVSGGVKSYGDALQYIRVVEDLLGPSHIQKDTFRIGASSLAKELLEL